MLKFQNISKRFGGVKALRDVSFEVERATIHAIVGENGAGKSTLMKIAAGVQPPDEGEIFLDGKKILIPSPRAARNLGIALVPQEPALCPNLSVEDNLNLGREPKKFGLLDRKQMRERTQAALQRASLEISPETIVENLSSATQHLLQIAMALSEDAQVLILDEPTAALSEGEAQNLFEQLRVLRSQGVTIFYISHRLPEIFALCDTITVLRDGQHVRTQPASTLTPEDIVAQMVGRDCISEAQTPDEEQAETEIHLQKHEGDGARASLLKVENLSRPGDFGSAPFENVSFEIRAGEIVGLAGLVGSGRSEVARCIFGLDRAASGAMQMSGAEYSPRSPRDAIRAGLALVPEDRRGQGLVMNLSVGDNLSLPALASGLADLTQNGVIKNNREREVSNARMSELFVKTDGLTARVETLSGGNQQKVVIGKWLTTKPKVLIVDEPTQGVDVGAKAQVHRLLRELAANGFGVLVISSDLPEVLALSHRILVMRQGKIAGELPGGATAEDVMRLAALEN